jgi:protease I
MTGDSIKGVFGKNEKGLIAVLIEDDFDQTEFENFNVYFPAHGDEVVYMSHLWGQPSLFFRGNPDDGEIRSSVNVETGLATSEPADYCGFLTIGAYAMDRLRSETSPKKGQPNSAPAVELMRRVMRSPGVKVGTMRCRCSAPIAHCSRGDA